MKQQKSKTKKNKANESIVVGLVVATAILALRLAQILMVLSEIKKYKPDAKWSPLLRKVLGDNSWNVIVVEEKSPNAFAIVGKFAFLTSGLVEMMTEREVIAVLLHEAYHASSHHVIKDNLAQYPILLILFSIVPPPLLFVFFGLLVMLPQVMLNRILGRKFEYNADAASVKYGYGDDMISALKKIQEWIKKQSQDRQCGKICQIIEKINRVLDEHPEFEDRIKNILKKKEQWEKESKKGLAPLNSYLLKSLKEEK